MASAVIFGASGATGRELVLQSLAGERFDKVHVIVRRASQTDSHPKLVEYVVPSMTAGKFPVIDDIDVVFCALGTTIAKAGSKDAFAAVDHDLIVAVGSWTKAAGAKQLHVVSSMGATTNTRNFYLKTKGETERDLEALGLPSLTLYQPSLLHAPDRGDRRIGETLGYFVLSAVSWVPLKAAQRIKPVPVSALADCMLRRSATALPGCHRVTSEEIIAR